MMLSRCVGIIKHGGARTLSTCRILLASQEEFDSAQTRLKTLKEAPGNDVKLQIYALFKQANSGDATGKRPGMMDFVGRAKWDAWNGCKNMSPDDARQGYVDIVNKLTSAEAATAEPTSAGSDATFKFLDYSVNNKLCTIKFNRPEKKNAINLQMYEELSLALKQATDDANVTLAVTTGAGDYYSSGNDLSNFMVDPKDIPKMAVDAGVVLEKFVNSFIEFPKPLIGLINGPAVGIPVSLLGLYDAVYASDRATFHTPFTALGQSAEACATITFPSIMGFAKSSEMLLLNRKITAMDAEAVGLVSRVLPNDTFQEEAAKLMEAYAQLPVKSLVYSKELIRGPMRETLHKVNKAECDRLVERWQSEDCMAAIMKFFSKSKL